MSADVSPSLRPLLWLVAAALFMQTLDATIVNTALPAIADSLQRDALAVHAVVVAYTLTMALVLPASGWLPDRFGTRRVFLAAVLVFGLGSLLCALAQTLGQLVAARVVQGLGGACLLPVGRLAVLRSVPRERFLAAMSFIAMPGLLGPLIGPSLGGYLVQVASWHWIFLMNLPICAVGLFLAWRFMPQARAQSRPRFDATGYALLAAGMLCISLALEGLTAQLARWPLYAALACLGLALWLGYGWHAQRCVARGVAPLFAPSLVAVPTVRLGLLGNVASRLGSSGMPYLLPLLLQLALGYSPAQAGLMMIPAALASIAAKPLVTQLVARHGYRRVLVGNTVCIGLLMMAFALLGRSTPVALQVLLFGAYGLCNSLQYTAMNTLTLRDVSASQASGANSLLSLVQMSAISLGLALAAVTLALFTQAWQLATHSPEVIRAFRAAFVCLGLLTILSARVFAQLPPDGKTRPA